MKANHRARSVVSSSSLALILLATSPYGVAQMLEEVVVTATKREESLQDVPISVVAVSGAELARRDISEVSAFARTTPGLDFKNAGATGASQIQIRGIGTFSFSRGVEQSVSTVVDGVISSSVATSLLDFSDIARVEVLRGPQGTLFGKNASAGVLNISTNDPTDEFEGKLGVSYADENEIKVNGAFSGALSDALLGRLSFYSNTRDGLYENVFPGGEDGTERDEWGVRGKLLWNISEDLEAKLSINHVESDSTASGIPAATRIPVGRTQIDDLDIPSGSENDKINQVRIGSPSLELDQYTLQLDYQLGDLTLTSITGYQDADVQEDAPGLFNLPFNAIAFNQAHQAAEQTTQEFRITSPKGKTVEYIAGLYYYDRSLSFNEIQSTNPIALGEVPAAALAGPGQITGLFAADTGLPCPCDGARFGTVNMVDVDDTSYSVFGNLVWNINDAARIGLGLRWDDTEVKMNQVLSLPSFEIYPPNTVLRPLPGAPVPGSASGKVEDDAVSWRVSFEYDISEEVMLYASNARGYKGPGANTARSASGSIALPIVEAEVPTAYELGIKSRFWNGRAQLNAAVFHTTVEDFQTQVALGDTVPPSFVLANAEEAETQGVELEFSVAATQELILSASLAYTDAEFTDYEGAQCYLNTDGTQQTEAQGCIGGVQDLSGEQLPGTPEWSYSLSAAYQTDLASMPFDAFAQMNYSWQDEVQFSVANGPNTVGDSYGIADLVLGVVADSERWRVQIFAKNLFDEFWVAGRGGLTIPQNGQTSQSLDYEYQRRIGISAQFSF